MEQEKNTVRAVERALDILLCFTGTESELGLSEISKQVGLHKSTVHRLLASLESRGFIRKHPQSEKYRLGWSVLELVKHAFQSNELASIVLPEMVQLRDRINETISLYIRAGHERIRIQAVESHHPIRSVANIGHRFPLYIGASGKVLLAFSDDSVRQSVFLEMNERFSKTELEKQLNDIQEKGFAVSIEEREPGGAAVAAPILDRHGQLIAALSVSGPVDRFHAQAVEQFSKEVIAAAEQISKMLLY
ncbi:IclR family transcriptional regulator [Fodinisporobacter ferrooxydans]|uniref:IclR family transcriptional regulator n=1 Tax=Fodinisporobacter ferrooxydans TaxID=2901836 RepID=A0ABY4CNT5_9BACL|nr:IclR family transcriptional regulator [Alicyclobacillaceae bacterium MYW30-H2]